LSGAERRVGLALLADPPIVMCSSVTELARRRYRVGGLQLGADDYLVKPFEFPELIARLRALQRRSGHRTPPQLRFGDLRLDPFTHQAFRADRLLPLSPKEFRILEQLLTRRQRSRCSSACTYVRAGAAQARSRAVARLLGGTCVHRLSLPLKSYIRPCLIHPRFHYGR
jgi:CheY-like chemotaxis protein